jgi:sec1 family domain-containing protein 1
MLEMIRDPAKDAEDKMRLFLIYFLSLEDISNDEIAEYTRELKAVNCETASLEFAKTYYQLIKNSNVRKDGRDSQPNHTSNYKHRRLARFIHVQFLKIN